jgi:3-oxo-5-alpha-steroid 4-dehydrogenase 3
LINLFLAPSFYLFANIGPILEILYKPYFKHGFGVTELLGILLYCYASYQQHICHKILAQLRASPKEQRYFIPHGGLFELISCPHYFAELLIYMAFLLVLGDLTNLSMWLILTFVVVNLTTSALETHRWYKQQFGDAFPKYRRAIIPFVL